MHALPLHSWSCWVSMLFLIVLARQKMKVTSSFRVFRQSIKQVKKHSGAFRCRKWMTHGRRKWSSCTGGWAWSLVMNFTSSWVSWWPSGLKYYWKKKKTCSKSEAKWKHLQRWLYKYRQLDRKELNIKKLLKLLNFESTTDARGDTTNFIQILWIYCNELFIIFLNNFRLLQQSQLVTFLFFSIVFFF